jgi:hypothetical protein
MKFGLFVSDLFRGRIKRLIGRANSFLESLAVAFPPVEFIKEFKDQTEFSMEALQDEEGPQPFEI